MKIPEFTAEAALRDTAKYRGVLRAPPVRFGSHGILLGQRAGQSGIEAARMVTPSGDVMMLPWNVVIVDDFSDLAEAGNEAVGCRNNPRHCCETDDNGKCTIWVAGCQACP